MSMLRTSAFWGLALATGLIFAASPDGRKIGERTARKLVEEALVATGKHIPSSQIRPIAFYWSPEFYNFEAVLGQSEGLPALRYAFSVNPWNGEVWSIMECTRVTSPAIEKEQDAIWKRSGLPAEAREPLHEKRPGTCAADDD